MRAKLKELSSPDVDLETYTPEPPDTFGFLLEAYIGLEGSEGADRFEITLCTPQWIGLRLDRGIIIGRHLLIVSNYNFNAIKDFVEKYCSRCVGNDWDEIAEKVSRLGHSEFEDYIPCSKG